MSRVVLLTIVLCGLGACSSLPGPLGAEDPGPRLLLAHQDYAGRMVILASDLKIPARIQEPEPLAYSDNASGAIWLGTRFPYDKAIKLIQWGRHYYRGLRYVALSDFVNPGTNRFDEELFLGGATETAVDRLRLRSWTEADFQQLGRVQSAPELHALIRSKYPAADGPAIPVGR